MQRLKRIGAAFAVIVFIAAGAAPAAALQEDPADTDTPEAFIAGGDEHFAAGDYRAARAEYEKAVELAVATGEVPTVGLRRIANAYYHERHHGSARVHLKRAARTLDRLAEEAASFGELGCEAWALADAAWVYGQLGDGDEVEARVGRLERLLGSPYMPGTVREEITRKRLGDATTLLTMR